MQNHPSPRRVVLAGLAALATLLAVLVGFGAPASATASTSWNDVNAQDRTYLRAAHQANLAEITAARIALQKATEPVTKQLARRWIRDHSRLDAALRPVAHKLGVALPDAPNAQQRALAARYRATSGPAFDRLWISTQMTAHHQAMALGEAELAKGSAAPVKKLARDAAPVIAKHAELLDRAERIVEGSDCDHSHA
jgi:putative membrane protein